jgi:hypothetical protein
VRGEVSGARVEMTVVGGRVAHRAD